MLHVRTAEVVGRPFIPTGPNCDSTTRRHWGTRAFGDEVSSLAANSPAVRTYRAPAHASRVSPLRTGDVRREALPSRKAGGVSPRSTRPRVGDAYCAPARASRGPVSPPHGR